MGILLAVPEIIAASVAGGAEALSIAGSGAAIATGEGLAALGGLTESAALLGETVEISEAAATVLTKVPELVTVTQGVTAAVQGGAGLVGGIYTALAADRPGDLPASTPTGSPSGLHPPAGYNPQGGGLNIQSIHKPLHAPYPGMALAPIPEYNLETGIPGVPDWVFNFIASHLPELPSLQDVFNRIAYGIWTSYYNTGRTVVNRAVSEELQRLLGDLEYGFRTALATIGESDPVNAIVEQVRSFVSGGRERELLQIAAGQPVDISQGVSRGTATISNAVEAVRDATQRLSQATYNFVYDASTLPRDGFNALSDGVHRLGQWISMPGATGGTPHYAAPDWILYVLEELNSDISKIPTQGIKRKLQQNGLHSKASLHSKTRKVTKKSTHKSAKPSKTSQKRRGRRAGRRTTVRRNRV
uniref:VP2 n=19 Tax=WU polyomavirus TaxID=440266 RepID=A0A2U3T9P2_POVWU|nr:VP2 [WU Polyomavirus]